MKVIATGNRKAWLVDRPRPRAEGDEVVVKLEAVPICGSNMGGFFAEGEVVNDGHEGAGVVVEVDRSSRVQVGDRVAVYPLSACGVCADCERGDMIYCANRPPHFGMFAQYTRTKDFLCVPLPDDVSTLHGALTGCALGPGYDGIRRLGLRAFETVVVTGLGPVGLGAVALANFVGARVLGVDPIAWRRERALALGAEACFDSADPDLPDVLKDRAGDRGPSRGIDCSGSAAAERLLIDIATVRGRVVFVGENHDEIPIRASEDFIRKGLTLIGCWHMNRHDVPDLIAFLSRAPEKAERLISHTFAFSEVQKAFDTFASRESAKVILRPWE